MAVVLLTEAGDKLIAEPHAGITGASSLNDTSTQIITKEDFDTDPTLAGWLLGSGWAWSDPNDRLQFTP